jgi:hypothetical protein
MDDSKILLAEQYVAEAHQIVNKPAQQGRTIARHRL